VAAGSHLLTISIVTPICGVFATKKNTSQGIAVLSKFCSRAHASQAALLLRAPAEAPLA
jgi:hypothetical protein